MGLQNHISEGDEIRLADVWQVLVRRRVVALTAFFVIFGAASLWLVFAKPVFESEGYLYIGRVGLGGAQTGTAVDASMLLEDPVPLLQGLKGAYGKEVRERTNSQVWIDSIQQDRGDPRLISFVVRGPSPQEAYDFAEKIVSEVISRHHARFTGAVEQISRELTGLRSDTTNGRAAVDSLSRERSLPPDQRLEITAALMYSSVQLGSIEARAGELEEALRRAAPTQIVQAPYLPKHAVFPRPVPTLSIGLLLGGLFALLAAYAAEALARSRDQSRS